MPTLKMAKRSAALEACKELHKIGALNDHLYPVNTFKCLENQKEIYFKIWNSQEFRNGINSLFKFTIKSIHFSKNFSIFDNR